MCSEVEGNMDVHQHAVMAVSKAHPLPLRSCWGMGGGGRHRRQRRTQVETGFLFTPDCHSSGNTSEPL